MSGPLAVALSTALMTIAGFGVLGVSRVARRPRDLLRFAGIAPLAGMAFTGCVSGILVIFEWRLSIAGLVALTCATLLVGALRLERIGTAPAPPAARRRRSKLDLALVLVSIASIGIVSAYALALFRIQPLFEYDGWAMWGMKSRALAVLGGADPDVFASEAYARLHLEYPLLIPSLHALPLQLTDGFSSNTVVLSCLALGLAGVLAIWGLLRDRVRPVLLLPFVAAIVAMPAFFGQLLTGYADVPLAMFVAAGVVAAARWLVDDERSWLALVTLFLAAAVLAKNEGLLYAAAAYVALLVVASGRRRAAGVSAGVVALVYAPWRAYVAIHDLGAPDYDLSASFDLPWVAHRLGRGPEAAGGLWSRATDTGAFGILLVLGIVSVCIAAVCGNRRLAGFAGAFGALSFAGLSWIYVLTPYDVSEFLATNGSRVVVSLVVALAALAPLLLEETVTKLSGGAAEALAPESATGTSPRPPDLERRGGRRDASLVSSRWRATPPVFPWWSRSGTRRRSCPRSPRGSQPSSTACRDPGRSSSWTTARPTAPTASPSSSTHVTRASRSRASRAGSGTRSR